MSFSNLLLQSGVSEPDSLISDLGIDFLDSDIDAVIMQTNEFLTSGDFTGGGPFFWILQACMALGAAFSIITVSGMAYKMMTRGENFDVMKLLRIVGIALVMMWWYPAGQGASVLGALSFIPNAIGSYTSDLYENEATLVQANFESLQEPLRQRQDSIDHYMAKAKFIVDGMQKAGISELSNYAPYEALDDKEKQACEFYLKNVYVGLLVGLDKIVMFLSIVLFRVGWWSTMYLQQILLGMLTIFGPIQWAFSVLPKWEGAWAKWIARYLTVHFYGAMLYFVGFYVLLLFDIVISIQVADLEAILSNDFMAYVKHAFMTSGYLLVASMVALKCLSVVPELAAWMVPEAEMGFAARNFSEGVASGVKGTVMGLLH